MKIIYSGGYDKYSKKSISKSMFYRYAGILNEQIEKGKIIASINFAKPDSYYNSRLEEIFRDKAIAIDHSNKQIINWGFYDVILLPGGDQNLLKEGLIETGFAIENLKKNIVIIGDSAGAYVMSSYYPSYDGEVESIDEKNITNYVEEGLYKESNVITIAHTNNKSYAPTIAVDITKKLAEKLDVKFLALKENEEKLLDKSGELVDFKITDIFK